MKNGSFAIPTKYLVKVDAEAKEAKYKVGDKVRVKGSVLLEGGVFSIIGADYNEKFGWRYELNIHEWYPEIDLDLYTQPTEQTEAHTDANEKLQEEYMRFLKGCMSGEIYTQSDFLKDYDLAKHEVNPKPRCIPKIMFNTEFWVKYEADLAKDIALKVTNRYNDPEETAKYAAKAAKQIVKHLKENK